MYSSSRGEIIFIAEDAVGKLLGFVSVWEQDSFVHYLFIDPRYQRQGVGKQLLESLFARLPLPYRLKCVTQNRAALLFYKKFGWFEVGRGTGEDGEYVLLKLIGDEHMIDC